MARTRPTSPSTAAQRPARVRSPFARAVLPNLAGLLVIVLLGLMLWGVAAFVSGDGTATSDRLAPSELPVGSVQNTADIVADDGPILFPGLGTTTGDRTLVLDHEGDDPEIGWIVYLAHPADADPECTVDQVIGTREFVDCDGRRLDVSDLAPPPAGVNPIVDGRLLSIDLRGLSSE